MAAHRSLLTTAPAPASRLRRALRPVALGAVCFAAACTAWLAPVAYFYSASQRASEVRQAARRVRLHELEARRAEKDFLLRSVRSDEFREAGSSPYLTRHADVLRLLRDDIERLGQLLSEPKRSSARALRENVDSYGASFDTLVSQLRRAGQAEADLRAAWIGQLEAMERGQLTVPLAAVAHGTRWLESYFALRPGLGYEAEGLASGAALEAGGAYSDSDPLGNPLLQAAPIQAALRELTELRQLIGADLTKGTQGSLRSAIHAVEPILDEIVAEAESAADTADALLLGGLAAACAAMGALLTWAMLLGRAARSRARELARVNFELERDMAARELAERELKSLLECAPEALLLVDAERRIVLGNAQAARLFGRQIEDLDRQGLDALVPRLDPSALAAAGGPLRAEGVRADGLRLPLEVSWSRFATGQRSYIFFALRDLTSQLSMLADLQQKHEQLLQAERLAAIGQMATGLAHESGNALQRSQACLDLLARRVADVPGASALVARIQEAQDHLQRLHGEVRDYAAPVRLQRQDCELAGIVQKAWESLALAREGRPASLEQRCPAPPRCEADAFALEQVFRNLLKNALEASSGETRISVTWTREERDGLAWLQASIRDRGRGLTDEERRRLFEPFFTTKTRGTGLGLSIARRIVEAHGGVIGLGEAAGPGTEMIVRLPVARRVP